MSMKNKRLIGIVLAVAILLLIPLIAGFPWFRLDFLTAGVLLLGTGLLCELVMRKVKNSSTESVSVELLWQFSSSVGQELSAESRQ
jgi:hypothetical protein